MTRVRISLSEKNLDDTGKKKLLKHARKSIFSLGVGDIASKLCRANAVYGLSKIQWMQKELGMEPNATFITGPDETISRNRVRWQSGYGYGGRVSWGSGNEKLVVLNVMVNACGMLLGGLEEEPDMVELIQRLTQLHEEDTYINDIKITWDLGKSNHFVDIFKVKANSDDIFPEYAFIIHSGAPEIKGDHDNGPGLYYRKSKYWQEKYNELKTPFDSIYYLDGNDALEYYEYFQFARNFSVKRREYAAAHLFDNYKIISSTMHQTLPNMNEILLGTHDTSSADFFPVTLRADRPAFIMRPRPNLSDRIIDYLDFRGRAEKLGVLDRLKNANILPHGGGYTFPFMTKVHDVKEVDGTRYFVISMRNTESKKVLADLREIQYRYRDEKVIERTLELELGQVVARLEPIFVLKI
jgi:hypothetical protein